MVFVENSFISEEELHSLSEKTIFSIDEIYKLYNRFQYLDRKGDGIITASDLCLLPEFNCNPLCLFLMESIEKSSQHEYLNFLVFLQALETFSPKMSSCGRKSYFFKVLDINNSKKICRASLSKLWKFMHGEDVDEKKLKKELDEVFEICEVKTREYLNFDDISKFYDTYDLDRCFLIDLH